jgi:ribosomal protein S4E
MQVHELKTWPVPFQQVMDGRKTHEYRKNDRDYHVGDTLLLRLYEPAVDMILPVYVMRKVTAITHGPDFGIPVGYCVMSIAPEGTGPT